MEKCQAAFFGAIAGISVPRQMTRWEAGWDRGFLAGLAPRPTLTSDTATNQGWKKKMRIMDWCLGTVAVNNLAC